jgi:hypothetical protein
MFAVDDQAMLPEPLACSTAEAPKQIVAPVTVSGDVKEKTMTNAVSLTLQPLVSDAVTHTGPGMDEVNEFPELASDQSGCWKPFGKVNVAAPPGQMSVSLPMYGSTASITTTSNEVLAAAHAGFEAVTVHVPACT